MVYDGASNITSYVDAGGTVTYGYDHANNVTSLAEPGGSCTGTVSKCTTFGYDNNNNRTLTTYPNGVTQAVTYDNSGRQSSIIDKLGATVLKSLSYSYSDTGANDRALVQKATDNVSGNVTTYTYDNMDHLTDAKVKNSSGTVVDEYVYTYDGNGNRSTAFRLGASTINYTYDNADELTNTTSYTWGHDANGNLTTASSGFSGTYNDRDQSTSITQAGGTATAMGYADFGQHDRTGSGSTSFLNGLLGVQSETTGSTTTTYIRDPGGNLVATHVGSTAYYYLFDNLGSVIGLTNSAGSVVQSFAYDPYGKVLTTGITVDSAYKFAGGYYDNATKLYHLGDRYYDPNLGQWTQRDTSTGSLASPAGINKFTYANSDPVNGVDPTGHDNVYADEANGCGNGAALTAGVSAAADVGSGGANIVLNPVEIGGGCLVGAFSAAYEDEISSSAGKTGEYLYQGAEAIGSLF